MRRQIFLVRVVFVVFFSCSVCLPFDHTCFDGFASTARKTAGQEASSYRDSGTLSSPRSPSWVGVHHVPNRGGSCLACLWSQTLQLRKGIAGIGVPELFSARAILCITPGVLIANVFDVTSKRGPPTPLSA